MNIRSLNIKIFIIIIVFIFIGGCTAGGGGGVNNAIKFDQQNDDVNKAWKTIFSDPDMALKIFEKTLYEKELLTNLENEIYCGMGWAYANKKDNAKAIEYFTKVQKVYNDAALGLGAVYIAQNTKEDYEKAIHVLKSIGLEKTGKQFISEHDLPYSTADAYALMAIAYYFTGNVQEAVNHIIYAKDQDKKSAYVNSIYNSLVNDLTIDDDIYFFK